MRTNLLMFALLLPVTSALAADQPSEMGHIHHGGAPHSWTAQPMLKARVNGKDSDGMVVNIVPQNIVVDGIAAWSNDLAEEGGHRQLSLGLAGVRLDRPKNGGFHWLSAREEIGDQVRVASTVYYFGNPGKNPTAMFMQQRHELEIIPQPFPREHSRYRADENWKFLVRFNGNPLPAHKVVLETQNGTKSEFTTDVQGILMLHLPDDFKDEEPKTSAGHGHDRPGADFVLSTELVDNGKSYLTAYNAGYGPDAFDKRNLAMGLGFVLLGMLGATPLLRQRKAQKKNDAEKEVV